MSLFVFRNEHVDLWTSRFSGALDSDSFETFDNRVGSFFTGDGLRFDFGNHVVKDFGLAAFVNALAVEGEGEASANHKRDDSADGADDAVILDETSIWDSSGSTAVLDNGVDTEVIGGEGKLAIGIGSGKLLKVGFGLNIINTGVGTVEIARNFDRDHDGLVEIDRLTGLVYNDDVVESVVLTGKAGDVVVGRSVLDAIVGAKLTGDGNEAVSGRNSGVGAIVMIGLNGAVGAIRAGSRRSDYGAIGIDDKIVGEITVGLKVSNVSAGESTSGNHDVVKGVIATKDGVIGTSGESATININIGCGGNRTGSSIAVFVENIVGAGVGAAVDIDDDVFVGIFGVVFNLEGYASAVDAASAGTGSVKIAVGGKLGTIEGEVAGFETDAHFASESGGADSPLTITGGVNRRVVFVRAASGKLGGVADVDARSIGGFLNIAMNTQAISTVGFAIIINDYAIAARIFGTSGSAVRHDGEAILGGATKSDIWIDSDDGIISGVAVGRTFDKNDALGGGNNAATGDGDITLSDGENVAVGGTEVETVEVDDERGGARDCNGSLGSAEGNIAAQNNAGDGIVLHGGDERRGVGYF